MTVASDPKRPAWLPANVETRDGFYVGQVVQIGPLDNFAGQRAIVRKLHSSRVESSFSLSVFTEDGEPEPTFGKAAGPHYLVQPDSIVPTTDTIPGYTDPYAHLMTMTGSTDELADLRDRLHAIETAHAPLKALLDGGKASVSVREPRVAISLASASGNIIVEQLTRYYTPGQDAPANVLVASPPSLGKSFAIRLLGQSYDRYLEHGCSDDMDEISTLLGSPIPDGNGGFLIVDGVLTEAMREAAAGRTVLFLLDEVLRLSPRAQEWLLTFLTGVKTPEGRVYRLRTRKALGGSLEMLQAPCANLHIVGATNLGVMSPVEAFWSRWETIRIDFSLATAKATGKAILASVGIPDPSDKLAVLWAAIVNESRKAVAENHLRFPVDFRILERAALLSPVASAGAVAEWASNRIADNVAEWNVDTGDAEGHSVATCVPWVTKLKTFAAEAAGK